MEVEVREAEEATDDGPSVQDTERGQPKKKRRLWNPHETRLNRSGHIQQPHPLLKNTEDIIKWRRRFFNLQETIKLSNDERNAIWPLVDNFFRRAGGSGAYNPKTRKGYHYFVCRFCHAQATSQGHGLRDKQIRQVFEPCGIRIRVAWHFSDAPKDLQNGKDGIISHWTYERVAKSADSHGRDCSIDALDAHKLNSMLQQTVGQAVRSGTSPLDVLRCMRSPEFLAAGSRSLSPSDIHKCAQIVEYATINSGLEDASDHSVPPRISRPPCAFPQLSIATADRGPTIAAPTAFQIDKEATCVKKRSVCSSDVPHHSVPRIGQVTIGKDIRRGDAAGTTTDIITCSDVPENGGFGRDKDAGYRKNLLAQLDRGHVIVPACTKRSLSQTDHTRSGESESRLDRDIKYYVRMRNFIERHIQELETRRDAERQSSAAL